MLYTGVTSDIEGRVWEHRNKEHPGSFTAKYNCVVLVYYRYFERIEEAIVEEKRIKSLTRRNKEKLINDLNPEWLDLYDRIDYQRSLD